VRNARAVLAKEKLKTNLTLDNYLKREIKTFWLIRF
jgi:hypothetical protein